MKTLNRVRTKIGVLSMFKVGERGSKTTHPTLRKRVGVSRFSASGCSISHISSKTVFDKKLPILYFTLVSLKSLGKIILRATEQQALELNNE